MSDEAIYRCINEACRRPAPRRVRYCPWCGSAQGALAAGDTGLAGSATGKGAATEQTQTATQAVAAAVAGASAAAALSGWSDAPVPAPAPSATAFGHGGKTPDAGAAGAGTVPPPRSGTARNEAPRAIPPQEVPRPPLVARPAQRSPIRLRWWILALLLLWGVWLLAKPSAGKIERRIDGAVALARACKGNEAQAELIALRKTRASAEQLEKLQGTLNEEAARCTRQRQRGKAWNEASAAIETALASASWEKAHTRLQGFTKRWGEDDDTRALRARIETVRRDEAERRTHPLAVPPQEGKFQ